MYKPSECGEELPKQSNYAGQRTDRKGPRDELEDGYIASTCSTCTTVSTVSVNLLMRQVLMKTPSYVCYGFRVLFSFL